MSHEFSVLSCLNRHIHIDVSLKLPIIMIFVRENYLKIETQQKPSACFLEQQRSMFVAKKMSSGFLREASKMREEKKSEPGSSQSKQVYVSLLAYS